MLNISRINAVNRRF